MLRRINTLKKDLSFLKLTSSKRKYTNVQDANFDFDVIVIGGGHAGCEAG